MSRGSFTCSPSPPGFRPRQRCPWTSRATPWSTTPASQTSRALKSALTTLQYKLLPEETGLNFDHISWDNRLQKLILKRRFLGLARGKWVQSRAKTKDHSHSEVRALLTTSTSVRSRWWLLATVPRCLRFVCDQLVGPLPLPKVDKDLQIRTH